MVNVTFDTCEFPLLFAYTSVLSFFLKIAGQLTWYDPDGGSTFVYNGAQRPIGTYAALISYDLRR